ncbi:mannose-1-phosphate guanylyltransferase/mannose-6-phosphate isomerase [Glaciimonas sp. CA11.2]|uniref:mannose-1-phosphate guanylyltransferase/mannose-6-phosphate isomerase n=1 Tax=Glaciimonas sp. CA11.2 TaxID=3048601 RepID=UPI002AB52D66|nr:mannose-1-phosphate guanylyltransferase/mannose-6-phosphate isomerase [Glaciimonas sp. CA11.2]MDY7545661.1 mannose-1-phosphate guanylyltransferase/mannose-6-phosphate isomerase [Glaciimonas sp. CA11.2]MEB0163390.1 mannose-1-phosphate guanylyltransferase/mannose-6-phosphate isomerase [Glaciimonas sp. CA11.2]
MTNPKILPIILCGGSGTRLWPLSRKAFPKQFVPLVDKKSLVQLTFERMLYLSDTVMTVAAEEHRFLVQEASDAAKVKARHILEPMGRNTAPAMAVAALNSGPDDLLLFAPADHHIPDGLAFAKTVKRAVPAAEAGNIVTFGIVPTFPSTAYGYIAQGIVLEDGYTFRVEQFKEKPNTETAKSLLLRGGNLWNAGIFLIKASVLLNALSEHALDILQNCKQAVEKQSVDGAFIRLDPEAFTSCRADSIDYAVLEKSQSVVVVPYTGQWSDVGSWNAVATLNEADADGNRNYGQGHVLDSKNTFVHAPHRLVVALGTTDLIIIDTPDAVMVVAASHAEKVKEVVTYLEQQAISQATQHRRTARPWGVYDSVDSGDRFQVKRITVKPGAQLSLQMHHHRAEHWIVVKGTAKVTRGDETFLLSENQSTYIPLGTTHRLENPGKTPLELIEVQSGSYLGEDDIVRFDDAYGRIASVIPIKNQA